jgi:2-dehydro-3-deoxyphosphooctonate aldolase (KDO 8-P synthase)
VAEPVTLDAFAVTFASDGPLVLIAGPCVLEDAAAAHMIARACAEAARACGLGYVFKASYDKANRTRLDAARGPGIERGLAMLDEVRRACGVPVVTDVHSPAEAARAGEVVDIVQVPAFLCRQTDLLVAAGATHRPVLIKKGQFLAAEDMAHAAAKVRAGGGRPILCERGSTFGPHDLVADLRSLVVMRAFAPVVFDATHAVQQPGGGATGGRRELVPALAGAAVAAGIAGLFLEVHPDPDRAPSDGPNMLPLRELAGLLRRVVAVRDAALARGR